MLHDFLGFAAKCSLVTAEAWVETVGFLAALATLATFAQTAIIPMRATAIVANACFIAYGVGGGHLPILALHLLLLPVNLYRLNGLIAARRAESRTETARLGAATRVGPA